MIPSTPSATDPAADAAAARHFGPFRLLALLGRSRRSMAWRVRDSRHGDAGRECLLMLPRQQPADAAASLRWEQAVRRASRLQHPVIAWPLEIGAWQRWPYVLYDAGGWQTLAERTQRQPLAPIEAAAVLSRALQALAFAHEGGVAHRDLQAWMLLVGEHGAVRVIGFEAGCELQARQAPPVAAPRTSLEALQLDEQRAAAVVDVLCAGLLLHQLLSGQAALAEPDLAAAAARLPPAGRDLVRLPWQTPLPVPEALRAIANRATDRQARQRYRSARALARALEGWMQTEGPGRGPLAMLLDRLHSAGTLPAAPDVAARTARLAAMDRERTNELAQVVLQDPGWAFELLRAANSAQLRALQASGNGSVLTVRRAIAMLGIDGVRRAALGLRPWPGPLSADAAQALHDQMAAAKRAARVAQALRPAGYDAEVAALVTLLQNLGRLTAGYHFPDEWQQIRRLMCPAPPEHPGDAEEAGMSEQAASYAVLGAGIEAIGAAVARHWGLDEAVLQLIRRLPSATPPRPADSDDELLRALASCANEAVDALPLPLPRRAAALRRVAQRYARVLRIGHRDLQEALNASGNARGGPRAAADEAVAAVEAPQAPEAKVAGDGTPA
ncbi:MAG TPA: HDOD domain-containing protein [Rubrivivax sp.]|nr:HDOD domain-containing protein [Rubrivivax sp.]